MPTRENIEAQLQQLQTHRHTLRVLLNQQIKLGTLTPAHIIIEIADRRAGINRDKAWLRGHGVLVEDLPDDTDSSTPSFVVDPLIPRQTQILGPQLTLFEWLGGWRRRHHPAEWRFLHRWISATVLGWLSVGVLTGPLQGWALRKRMGRHHPDMTLFWLIVVFLVVPALVWTEIAWLGGFWGGAAGGVLLGILQWIDLRRAALPTGLPHWLIANGLGGGIAQSLIVGAWHGGMPSPDLLSLRATPIVALAAALFALITGVTLGWLLHQRLPEE